MDFFQPTIANVTPTATVLILRKMLPMPLALLGLTGLTALTTLLLPENVDSFPLGGPRSGPLSDLVTASLLGAVLGRARNRLRAQRGQEENNQQPMASAQHHHPYYMPIPWHDSLLYQHSLAQVPQMLPSLHHPEMIQPPMAPIFPDMAPWLLQMNHEQQFLPMASELEQTVFPHPVMPHFSGFDYPALESLRSWQILPQNPMNFVNLVNYGSHR